MRALPPSNRAHSLQLNLEVVSSARLQPTRTCKSFGKTANEAVGSVEELSVNNLC